MFDFKIWYPVFLAFIVFFTCWACSLSISHSEEAHAKNSRLETLMTICLRVDDESFVKLGCERELKK